MSADNDPEGFAIIPRWLQQDASIAGYVKLVYLAIASHVNRSGITSLSHRRIAAEASCSVASVKRALVELRALDVLSWTEQYRDGGTGQTSNVYKLVIGNAAYSRPATPAYPSSEGTEPSSAGATPQLSQSWGVAQGELPKNESQKNESQKNETSLVNGSAADQATPRTDVLHLVKILAELMTANGTAPATIPAAWTNAARLLLDRDGASLEEAEKVLRWCQADSFWSTNILSMPTFRKQYLRLRAKMRAANAGGPRRPTSAADQLAQLDLDLAALSQETHQ
jgi:hypothetical protein